MTNEQALEILKQRRRDYENIIKMNLSNCEIQRRKELFEATKLAIQALEKQALVKKYLERFRNRNEKCCAKDSCRRCARKNFN